MMNKKITIRTLFVFFIISMKVPAVCADIYVYIDNEGVRHFTNVPTSPQYRLYMSSPKSSSSYSYDSYSSSKYDQFISEAADKYSIPVPLLKAVIKVESNFNPNAVSRKGAQGLMQLMPDTARLVNVSDSFDPWENIMGGSRYLKMLMDRFGELSYALAGYNAGPERVVRHNGIPPIAETQDYVQKVTRYYKLFNK